MKITFLGAAHEVTGSQFLIDVNHHQFLLDCGLYQGSEDQSYERNRSFRFDPSHLEAVILSHAHIDHSGNLPNLVKKGFGGPIYTTSATAALADVLLRDSAHIQESDAEEMSELNRQRHLPPVKPIYTLRDAEDVNDHFRPIDYFRTFQPVPGVSARLIDAGHIIGSAAVSLDIQETGKKPFRLWFSGDIGQRNLALVKDPILPEKTDVLMMECTYGDTRHDVDPKEAFEQFREVVKRTIGRGGKLIVPAFAVGRTQELVFALNQMIQNGEIEPIPVFVDSPLAVEASKVYGKMKKFYDQEAHEFIENEDTSPLAFESLRYISSVQDSKALNHFDKPMVIISASGMAETGRVVHHIRANIENPQNTIAIVSWQAPGTLGRRLVDGQKKVSIWGDEFDVRAEIVEIDGFSAHAGQRLLVEYALANNGRTQQIILVHGEPDAAGALQQALAEKSGPPVVYPDLFETLEI